ncbi:MAG: hypothetical protein PVJ72_16165, partial [Gammaproteobacteria bacterium]
QGGFQDLKNLEVPLKVLEEIVTNNAVAATFIAQSVNSRYDLKTWFNILSLPARGWFGTNIPMPKVSDTDCNAMTKDVFTGTSVEMSSIPCRLTGQRFSDWLTGLALNDNEFLANPNRFVRFLDVLYEAMPFSPTTIRRNLFVLESDVVANNFNLIEPAYAESPTIILRPLKYIAKLSSRAAKNTWLFFLGRANHRINPLATLFIMYYLDSRVNPEKPCTGSCRRIQLDDANADPKKIIDEKVNRIMANIANAGILQDDLVESGILKCGFSAHTHGNMFELLAIAYFHALYESDNDRYKEYKVVGIEKENKIDVLGAKKQVVRTFKRRSDVILQGGESGNVFVELKSIQSASAKWSVSKRESAASRNKFMGKWPYWKVIKGKKTTYHRQFTLDHFATVESFDNNGDAHNGIAGDFKWWFHSWGGYEKKRESKRNGKTIVYDPGVPMNKVGSGLDTDYHRVINRLAQADNDTNRRFARLKSTLNLNQLFVGTDIFKQRPGYFHLDPSKIRDHAEILNWTDLERFMPIPPEVQQQLDDIQNNLELELVLDMINNFEDIDFLPDIPVEDIYQSMREKVGDLSYIFSECDP